MNSQTEKIASLEKKLAEFDNIVDYLDSKLEKRLQLSVKQVELETKRIEASKKMDKKDKVICFLASLLFVFSMFFMYMHFVSLKTGMAELNDFLKSSLMETTTTISHSVEANDITASENIGNLTLEK